MASLDCGGGREEGGGREGTQCSHILVGLVSVRDSYRGQGDPPGNVGPSIALFMRCTHKIVRYSKESHSLFVSPTECDLTFVPHYLYKQEVELDGIILVNVLVREEELLSECDHGGLLNTLFPQRFIRVQPIHCMQVKIKFLFHSTLFNIIMEGTLLEPCHLHLVLSTCPI